MNDKEKTRAQLIEELCEARQRITELEAETTALRNSEQLYRITLNNISDPVFITDDASDLVFVCPNSQALFGCSPEEVEAMGNIAHLLGDGLFAPEELSTLGEITNIEREIENKNGENHAVLVTVKQVDIQGGTVLYVIHDITERKKTQNVLSENEQKFRAIVENSQPIIFMINRSGVFTLSEGASLSRLGLTPGQIVGMSALETYKDYPSIIDAIYASWRGETVRDRNLCIKGIDVENLYFDVFFCPYKNSEGEIVGTIGMAVDITERKLTEIALQKELRIISALATLYKPLISQASTIEDITNVVLEQARTLTGSEHGFVSEVDPITGDNIGHTLTEMLKDMCQVDKVQQRIVFPIGTDGLYGGLWGHALNTKEAFFTNSPTDHSKATGIPEGHVPLEQYIAVPVILDDAAVGLIALANSERDYDNQDIEVIQRLAEFYALAIQRIRLEEDARNTEILQVELEKERELVALKDNILSIMSHDFRTPLSIIQTSSDLITRYFDKMTPERRNQSIQQIRQQVVILIQMIDDILLVARGKSGHINFSPAEMELEAFCREIFDQVQFSNKSGHDFEFSSHIPELKIMADGKLLQHILNNLLTNAVKFSPKAGRIEFELDRDNESVVIRISDEGIGIPEKDMARLFEPFHRADNVSHIAGTGLGLSIVKQYVELHGGRIEVESTGIIGNGSVFSVWLPVGKE